MDAFLHDIAAIVAMEVIYITWFFYLVLLAIYDPAIIGDQNTHFHHDPNL